MACFRRVSSSIKISSPWFWTLTSLFFGLYLYLDAQPSQPLSLEGRLRVLGVRKMTEEEYKHRVHDDIGATYTLRLRYEAPTEEGIYLYVPNGVIPFGYSLERTGPVVQWLVGTGGTDGSHSPGVERLEEQTGKRWLFLPARTALEWETEIDPTPNGKEDAKSIFVRDTLTASPVEVVSDWFSTDRKP